MKKLVIAALASASMLMIPSVAQASSHREAPFITRNPKVDGTDFYMFNSYEQGRGNFVTLIANYQPLQDAYGGPNYFTMDPEALYEIHVDNTGDAVEDISFQFRFNNALANNGAGVAIPVGVQADGGGGTMVAVPLTNVAQFTNNDGGFGPGQNVRETYTVNVVRNGRRSGAGSPVTNAVGNGTTFIKPFDNVGSKTFPANSYSAYARQFIYSVNIPGCNVPANLFVGQRAEGFAVNLGTIFDLVNADPTVITDPAKRGLVPNPLEGKNISTIALEIDKSCLNNGANTVIAGWTTASVRQARVINPAGRYAQPAREGGAWAQVSRLGMPLVNEVVIGVPDKDRFNSSEPKDDLSNFAGYIVTPTLPKLINILFGVPEPTTPRNDLVVAFATGVPGVNKFPNFADGGTPAVAEMLRLNTGLPATTAASQNNLGAAGCFVLPTDGGAPELVVTGNTACDPAGFPNGRRPGDDVVDVALRVSIGYLLPASQAGGRAIALHDAVLQDASQFDTRFPYLKTPNPGTP